MADTINITVNETIDNIVVNSAISTDVIDFNLYATTETINIDVTPELTTVNINSVSGGGLVTSVNGQIGDVVISAPSVNDATTSVKGIVKLAGDLAGTADLPTVPNKVDKVTGKGLSTNDFTNTLKTKLDGIADGAEVNVNADWNATSGDAQILNKPTIPSISGLELQANKQNSLTVDGTGVKYPTVDAVNSGLLAVNTNSIRRDTVKLATAINKGQAVYVSSASGTNIIVSKASNASEATSSKTIGLLETTGATNDIVNVVTDGLLTGLDTSTATIGDPVWLGVAGNLIFGLTNKPYAPAHLVYIGVVTRVNANNGEILVKVQNGFQLKEIHDVDLITTSPTNNQALIYESASSLWKNKTINSDNVTQGSTNLFLTSAERTKLTNTSGTNSGNETTSTLGATINGSSAATPNDTDIVTTVESSVVKKITWTNVKAFLKTYFDTIYTTTSAVATQITTALSGYATQSYVNSQGFITNVITALGYTPPRTFFSAVDGTVITNTTTITATYSQSIPANVFSVGDVINLNFRVTSSSAKSAPSTMYIYINTSNSVTGATQIGQYLMASGNRGVLMERNLSVKGATTRVFNATSNAITDVALTTAILTSLSIDWTVQQFIIFAIGHSATTETSNGDFYKITKN